MNEGHPRRISELQQLLEDDDMQNRPGLTINRDYYTRSDAGSCLLRFLKMLPEAVVPYKHCDAFCRYDTWFLDALKGLRARPTRASRREMYSLQIDPFPINPASSTTDDHYTDSETIMVGIMSSATALLPKYNQWLLEYIIDLMARFLADQERDGLDIDLLVSVFQPSILAHPPEENTPDKQEIANHVVAFLVEDNVKHLCDGAIDPSWAVAKTLN